MRTYKGYERAEPPIDQAEQTKLIQDAYARLGWEDKALLDVNSATLCGELKGCGTTTALEILAALGRLMVQAGEPGK